MQFFSKEAFQFGKQMRDISKVKNITICGLFIALYIILSYFNIKISDLIEIRFGFVILALAGFYGGPVMGLIVGAASDVISMLLTAGKGSAFFFGFTVSYALLGFLFGVVLYKSKITIVKVLITALIQFLISVTLNSVWLHTMYGMPWEYLMTMRLMKEAIMFPINSIILYIIMNAFTKVAIQAGLYQN